MTHKDLAKLFEEKFPSIAIKQFWKKGPTAIRVRCKDGTDVVFTYISKTEWKLESMKTYEKSVDGI